MVTAQTITAPGVVPVDGRDVFPTDCDDEISEEMSAAGAAIIASFYDQALDWMSMWKAREIYTAMRLCRSKL